MPMLPLAPDHLRQGRPPSKPEGFDVPEPIAGFGCPRSPLGERGLQLIDHEGIADQILDFLAERPQRPVLPDGSPTKPFDRALIEVDADL